MRHQPGKFMDCEVWALPRTINGEKAQASDAQTVEMRIGIAQKFAGPFSGGIRRNRCADGIVLREGALRPFAIDRGGRAKEKVSDTEFSTTFEQIERPLDVDLTVEQWLFNRWPDTSTCRQVDDDIYGFVLEETPQKLVVTDITLAKDEMRGCGGQRLLHILLFYGRRIKVVEIV